MLNNLGNELGRRRSEFQIAYYDQLGIKNWKEIKRFYIPDQFVREYLPKIKKIYGKSTTTNIACVFMALSSYSDKKGISFPSYETIMNGSLISNKNSLKKTLKIMDEDLNLIKIDSGKNKRRSNNYVLVSPKHWNDPNSIKPPTTVSKVINEQYQSSDTIRALNKDIL